jgi:hypothetical protein
MVLQEHLPRQRQATREEEWGYTFWEFITGNLWYLLGILIVLGIFLYARSYFKKHKR